MFIPAILITDSGAPTEFAMHHTCYQDEYHQTFDKWCLANGYTPRP
jgi:hypothetical protein